MRESIREAMVRLVLLHFVRRMGNSENIGSPWGYRASSAKLSSIRSEQRTISILPATRPTKLGDAHSLNRSVPHVKSYLRISLTEFRSRNVILSLTDFQ